MMTVSGKYAVDTNNSSAAAADTIFPAAGDDDDDDLKFTASFSDLTFSNGPSLNGLLLSLYKPSSFSVSFDVTKKDFRFQFKNRVRVLEKPVDLTYIHSVGENRTLVDGTVVIDEANKVSASHTLGQGVNGRLRYSYVHGGVVAFEPCYDLGKNAWDFGVSGMVFGNDVARVSYQTVNRNVGLEWVKNSKVGGCFKVTAIFNLAEGPKLPKLVTESSWNLEL